MADNVTTVTHKKVRLQNAFCITNAHLATCPPTPQTFAPFFVFLNSQNSATVGTAQRLFNVGSRRRASAFLRVFLPLTAAIGRHCGVCSAIPQACQVLAGYVSNNSKCNILYYNGLTILTPPNITGWLQSQHNAKTAL